MDRTFLIVGYRNARYAIEASVVQEVVWLPELSPLEEVPPFIRGAFSLRGQVTPVLDLGMRFGYGLEPLSTNHRLVVITEGGHSIGMLVHDMHDIATYAEDAVQAICNFSVPAGQSAFLSGVLKLDDGLVMLLDRVALVNQAIALEPLGEPPTPDELRIVGDRDAEVLRLRARELARSPDLQDDATRITYSVVRLGCELFGLHVAVVREFRHLRGLTPIPGAPPHVAGHINLRGDVLVIIDIRPMLGLATTGPAEEVAVVFAAGMQFGIVVEAIEEITTISATSIRPAASARLPGALDICPEVAQSRDGFVSLIDVDQMMTALVSQPVKPLT